MTIKAVLLDLDDTLWPVAPVIRHAEQSLYDWMCLHTPAVCAVHSIDSLRQRRNQLVSTNTRFSYDLWALRHTLLTQVFREHGESEPESRADAAMQVFAHARNQVQLFPDVQTGLQSLGQRFQLGTVSNGFADLEQIGLAPHFQVSLAAHRFGCAKPDPRIFHAACDALGVLPEQTLYVGDDLQLDVLGAQKAGLRSAWMYRHSLSALPAEAAHIQLDLQVSNLHELVQILETLETQ